MMADMFASPSIPVRVPPRERKPEPPVEHHAIDIARLHATGACCRCGLAMARCDDQRFDMCGACASAEIQRDRRRVYPDHVWLPAHEFARFNGAAAIAEQLCITADDARKLRRRILACRAYDPAADAKGCYDVAIAELRKRHEAGE